MAKVVCEKCDSSFQFEVVKKMKNCPVCGEILFGDNVETGNEEENEELDFKHPDLYYYSIDSEDKYEDKSWRRVYCNCTSCKEINSISYSNFDYVSEEYVKLKKDLDLKCKGCNKPFTNIIVPKRPENWQRLAMWEKDYKNAPKCPTCSSINIKKISATSKVASVAMWGLLSRKVHKQWHCNVCGSEW